MFDDDGVAAGDGSQPSLNAVLAALADREPPGPAAVARLTRIDPARLTAGQRVDLLRALERQASWLAACQTRVLAALAGTGEAAEEFAAVEVAAALRLSPGVAQRRLDVARDLHRRLPGTVTALAAGRIGYWHATSVADATAGLAATAASAVERRVLPRAAGQSVAELRRALRRAVIATDPAAAQAARDRAAADRDVTVRGLPDGIAELCLTGPAEAVGTVFTALTALADRPRPPGDDRPVGARRFDAAVQICNRILSAGRWDGLPLPTRHGRRPHIQVTVAATTLLGLDETPAELAGHGPITAETARRIAAAGTWRRLLVDPPTGRLLDYGRTTYPPPADLAQHVIARDQTCLFPHCNQPALRCDIDHATAWDQGGTTDRINCGLLCRRHHQAKTRGGWTLIRHPDETATWISPTGKTYQVRPPPYSHDP